MGLLKNALSDKEITYRQFEKYNDRSNSQRHRAKPGEHKKLKDGTNYLEIGYPALTDIEVKFIKNVRVNSVFSETEANREYDYIIFELSIATFNHKITAEGGGEKEALLDDHDIEVKFPPHT